MNRDEAREVIKHNGITCKNVTLWSIARLRKILKIHLCQSGIYDGSAKLEMQNKVKFIEMKTNRWNNRECVSFNDDGFVGIAGWADDNNVKPIIIALIEWAEGERK